MNPTIHPRTRATLQDAIRNIYQMADLAVPHPSGNGSRRSLTLGVTSPNPGEGKTTIAIGLASSLADDLGSEVTLVDADFHTHSIELEYGLSGEQGLAELLDGTASAPGVRHQVPATSLSVVTAGTRLRDAERSVRTEHAVSLVQNMRAANSHVVYDLPAVLPSSTAPVLARLCDGVIVVVRCGRTTRRDVEASFDKLKGATVLGVVLNQWETSIPGWLERVLALRR